MNTKAINTLVLPGNDCFGCGHDNPSGLKISVFRDPENTERLIGTFRTTPQMNGFPNITHGGAIYTALDCLASWTPTLLRPVIKAAWVLRSSEMRYLLPAHTGMQLSLSAWIAEETKPWKPLLVQAEARDAKGKLLTEGRFKMVPLSPEKLRKVAGIDRLPENWQRLLNEESPS